MHHAETDWANDGQTNIDDLTLACGPGQPAGQTRRLENPKTPQRRPHRMDPTTPPRPGAPPACGDGQSRVNNHHRPQNYLIDNNVEVEDN